VQTGGFFMFESLVLDIEFQIVHASFIAQKSIFVMVEMADQLTSCNHDAVFIIQKTKQTHLFTTNYG